LPTLFAAPGALEGLAGGAAVAKNAVINSKHQSAEEEEIKRHNRDMENIAKSKQALSLTGSGLKKKAVKGSSLRKTVKTRSSLRT
jgi:hypothetical protein